ncbi:hypothetical protein ONS95_010491 [Cadophora gregata]|uniref:uncharacterized protein n=1 Tax=Cadophora gregata TaxID=51156 RepID=UPI0026DAFA50|nr:uncharacterized protein ONS95_010491 [Cadophora gregata]KAK0122238.1 hypothetical protein ONS95_010491 [Cadophora gregata]
MGYYDDCSPNILMKAFMVHRADRAIRLVKEDQEHQHVLEQELALVVASRDPDTTKWAAKIGKKEKKMNKKEKKHLIYEKFGIEIDKMLENGASLKECTDFAMANSKRGKIPVPIQMKLEAAFPPPGKESLEVRERDKISDPTEAVVDDLDGTAEIAELKSILLSSIQGPPSYISYQPPPVTLCETRREQFGPVPTNIDLLRKVYERRIFRPPSKPSEEAVKTWAADTWEVLYSSENVSGWAFEVALGVHELYTKMAAAPEILIAKRAEFGLRYAAETAKHHGEMCARCAAKNSSARSNSVISNDLIPLSQLSLETTSDKIAGDVVVPSNSMSLQESASASNQNFDHEEAGASQIMAGKDEKTVVGERAGATEEPPPPVPMTDRVVTRYYCHTAGERTLQEFPQFRKLARSKVFSESCLRIQHSYSAGRISVAEDCAICVVEPTAVRNF